MQAAGVKCELSLEHPAKRQKVAVTADVAKRTASQVANTIISITLTEAEEVEEKVKPANKPLVQDPKTASEPTTSFNGISHPMAEPENVRMSSIKLDKQPSSFKIVPPLPSELASVSFSLPDTFVLTKYGASRVLNYPCSSGWVAIKLHDLLICTA